MWYVLRFRADNATQATNAASAADGGGTVLGVVLPATTRATSIGAQVVVFLRGQPDAKALSRAATPARHIETQVVDSLDDLAHVSGWLGAAAGKAGIV